MRRGGGEGMASHYEQCTRFGNTYLLRNAGIGLSMLMLALIGLLNPEGDAGCSCGWPLPRLSSPRH